MTSTKRFFYTASLLVLSLLLGTGFAQINNANPLVGTWQTSIELGQGLPPATGMFQANANGQYREEMYIQGQLAAYWEGQYNLTPDGTLTQQETSKSPQICMGTQCMANEGPSTTTSRITLQGADAFTAMVQDPSSGQTFNINWQRAGNGTTPNQPATNQPVPNQPNATGQTPIVGTWQYAEAAQGGGQIIITLSYTPDGRFMVQRTLNGQQFISSYGGSYTFSNNMLVENTTEKSPQFCYLQCQPNPAQLGNSGPMQVGFPNANTLSYAGLNFQRAGTNQGGINQGGINQGGVPASTGLPLPGGYPTPVPSTGYPASPAMSGGMGTGGMDNSSFVDGVIWEQSPYIDPNTGGTFLLPDSPDPSMTYTSPGGNDMRYDDSGTWYEVDPYGFETEIEQGDW